MEAYGTPYAQASAAIALFDYLYLRPLPAVLEQERYNLAEDMRLNLDKFTQDEREEFAGYVLKSETILKGDSIMQRIMKNLKVHVWQRGSKFCRTSWLAKTRCFLLKSGTSS
jgi:hypothetical protein